MFRLCDSRLFPFPVSWSKVGSTLSDCVCEKERLLVGNTRAYCDWYSAHDLVCTVHSLRKA